MPKSEHTSTQSNLRDRVLGEVEKNSYIALPGRGGLDRFLSLKLCVPTYQEKIGLKINWPWPCPSEQDPKSPTASPSHQEASIASYPYPTEGRQKENHKHRKLTKLITQITALSNSMKLWPMPCRATQDRRIMVESSDKMWPTGKGNGNFHFHILALRTLWTVWKGKKIGHWNMNSTGHLVPNTLWRRTEK